jgi:hypothetical protein
MRILLLAALIFSSSVSARGGSHSIRVPREPSAGIYSHSHAVHGYVTKRGTYVDPHRQTNPNSTRLDNWSTKGNVNPYTGEFGKK